jgi:hypothetical protein
MALYETLSSALGNLYVAVHCTNPRCWRSGGTLDGPAFLARYGGDTPLRAVIERLRCARCGWPGAVSLLNALNKLEEPLPPPAGPRIRPPCPSGKHDAGEPPG